MSNLTVGILPVGSVCLSDQLLVQMQSYNMDQKSSQFSCFPQNFTSHEVIKNYPSTESAGYFKPVISAAIK